jgi:hypothetical protein
MTLAQIQQLDSLREDKNRIMTQIRHISRSKDRLQKGLVSSDVRDTIQSFFIDDLSFLFSKRITALEKKLKAIDQMIAEI